MPHSKPARTSWASSLNRLSDEIRRSISKPDTRERLSVLGATSVAVWFLILDTIAGRPFYTPSILGAALLGVLGPAGSEGTITRVIVYTIFHYGVFSLAGMLLVPFALAVLAIAGAGKEDRAIEEDAVDGVSLFAGSLWMARGMILVERAHQLGKALAGIMDERLQTV